MFATKLVHEFQEFSLSQIFLLPNILSRFHISFSAWEWFKSFLLREGLIKAEIHFRHSLWVRKVFWVDIYGVIHQLYEEIQHLWQINQIFSAALNVTRILFTAPENSFSRISTSAETGLRGAINFRWNHVACFSTLFQSPALILHDLKLPIEDVDGQNRKFNEIRRLNKNVKI